MKMRVLVVVVALAVGVGAVLTGEDGEERTAMAQSVWHHDNTGNVVVVAGDLVPDSGSQSLADAHAVANLAASLNPAKVIQPGDLQYEYGSLVLFQQDYDAVWGSQKAKIAPIIGNHEYGNGAHPDAEGFKAYFGAQGWPANSSGNYEWDMTLPNGGQVNFIALNSNCLDWNPVAPSCTSVSATANFLRDALQADGDACDIVFWHEPAFGSQVPYWGDGKDDMRTLWQIADANGADLVVTGHAHNYQRYSRMNYLGQKVSTGIPSIVAGMGGKSNEDVTQFSWQPEALNDTADGLLRIGFPDSTHFNTSFRTTSGSTLDSMPYGCS